MGGAGLPKHRGMSAALIVLLAAAAGVPPWASEPELTTVKQIHALTPAEANRHLPVHLRGQVTALSTYRSSFFFKDDTAGISVERNATLPQLHSGDRVELRGVTDASLFAPVVKSENVTLLGSGTLPQVRAYRWEELSGGQQDGNWIAMRGLIRSTAIETRWGKSLLMMHLDIGGGYLVVTSVHDYEGRDWKRLVGETATIRGVCGSVFNDRRQFMGLRLFAPSLDDISVEKTVPADPFATPLQPLDSFMVFGDRQQIVERVKVRGVVTLFKPGLGLYIQDGQRGLSIRTDQTDPLDPGQTVEVVGYPVAGRYAPILEDAVYRVTGRVAPVAPVAVKAADMSTANQFGFVITPYNAALVQMTGELLEEIPGPREDQLIVKEGDRTYTARLLLPDSGRDPLPPGTIVRLTGVSLASVDEQHDVRSFELLLRSAADIAVVRKVAWWKSAHAGWVVALVMIAPLLTIPLIALWRYHSGLRAMAMTDPLTDLRNRRGFFLQAEQLWQLALRRKATLLLFYLDIDEFKEINDSLGHKAGDHALQSVAQVLRECFRDTDVLARMGGDEFATACMAPEESQAILEARLHAVVEEHNRFEHPQARLKLSVGVLLCDSSMASLKIGDLLLQADALMYEQKRARKLAGAAEELAPDSTS